jgi:hypothetical protein
LNYGGLPGQHTHWQQPQPLLHPNVGHVLFPGQMMGPPTQFR